MKVFKGGITGSGMMLDYHIRAFSGTKGLSVKACTRDYYGDSLQQQNQKLRCKAKAAEYNLKFFDTYEQMLADEELDFIIIASINPYHERHIIRALEYGKHVLVEKPIVTTLEALDRVEEKATACGKLVFPSHNFVYRPALLEAKKVLDSGALGTLVYASFVSCFRSNDEHAHGWRASAQLSAGGALMDSGYHQIYQSLFLLGEPALIQCFLSNQVQKHMEVEDFAMINAAYKDGCIASIGQGHSSHYGDVVSGIKIVGANGNIVISDACYFSGQRIAEDADYTHSFSHQAQYFLECLNEKRTPLSNLADVRNTLKIIHASYKSAEKAHVVAI